MAALTGQLTDEQKAMIRKSVYEFEVSKLGGFQRIFPTEASWEKYAFELFILNLHHYSLFLVSSFLEDRQSNNALLHAQLFPAK